MGRETAVASPLRIAARETVTFRGHPMVRSEHPTTIEVTTEEHLTENGDCIIGVASDKGCAQLSVSVRDGLRRTGSRVLVRIKVGSVSFAVHARGDRRLQLTNPRDIVIRKSDFISERTLAVRADASARDIPREMISALRDPAAVGSLEIEVL